METQPKTHRCIDGTSGESHRPCSSYGFTGRDKGGAEDALEILSCVLETPIGGAGDGSPSVGGGAGD